MADDNNPSQPRVAAQDYAHLVDSPVDETRRTSVSSAATSNPPEPARQASIPVSQTSMASDNARSLGSRPRPLDYGSIRSSTTANTQNALFPSAPSGARQRPGVSKRTTSSTAPYRGRPFSVDDDASEVDRDLELARQHTREHSQRERHLRRRESTLRRRPTAQPPGLPRVESDEREEESAVVTGNDMAASAAPATPAEHAEPSSEDTLRDDEVEDQEEEEEEPHGPEHDGTKDGEGDDDDNDDDADLSDAESFTLKDRQEAINETHPFGIRIWKPALYKKSRSVQRNAEGDIHSAPGGNVSRWLFIFNILWTLIFGWWLALIAALGGLICHFFCLVHAQGCAEYGRVLLNLASYLFYPFGKYVRLEHDEAYMHEDEGEGRSISEYERWQTGDLEEGRLFFGPTDINRSIIGRRRDSLDDLPDADETDSLLGRPGRSGSATERSKSRTKRRLFGRGDWNLGRVIFFLNFYFLLTPCLFLVSALCWFGVFTIPMGKVTLLLFYHLRRHPLVLSFQTDSHYARSTSGPSSILLCTYRAVGLKYWKYTIDGTNVFLINLLGLVVFAIFDYFVLYSTLHIESWITSPGFNFVLGLLSIIPLAYFIGQAVASISAQSSMGVGATVNAFFSTVVEVFLYCVALNQGKAQLVEGSIVGSIFAGILFLPGLSMCFGALKRKTQRFNVRSAGVTSTMLLFAVIGAFGPTLFYQIYGSHELNCHDCSRQAEDPDPNDRDCRRCYFSQVPTVHSRFYIEAVRPYIWFASVLLFASYVIGLMFTLRTHAAVIWNNESDEKKEAKTETAGGLHIESARQGNVAGAGLPLADPRQAMSRVSTAGTLGTLPRDHVRESVMYKRILNQSLRQAGVNPSPSAQAAAQRKAGAVEDGGVKPDGMDGVKAPYLVPPKSADGEDVRSVKSMRIHGLSAEDNRELVQQVAEMAATAATVAARDATKAPRSASRMTTTANTPNHRHHSSKDGPGSSSSKDPNQPHRTTTVEPGSLGDFEVHEPSTAAATNAAAGGPEHTSGGGHDAPNWSRTKSAIILLTATVAYAVIAEILVDTVDAVLSNFEIDEKFLGITLFALVPNTTEFLNAISFAMNGNIALSMEIGNSYALQVMLLQIPALVLFSAVYGRFVDAQDMIDHTFTLIFPQWDMVTVILGVFLLGYVVGEGKSNYFKGSSLILTYLVFVVGFWFSTYNGLNINDVDRYDAVALGSRVETFRTVGLGRTGRAY